MGVFVVLLLSFPAGKAVTILPEQRVQTRAVHWDPGQEVSRAGRPGSPAPTILLSVLFEGFAESRERKKSPRHHVSDALGAPETDSLSTSRNMDYPPALAAQCHGRAHVPRGNLVMRHLAKVWPSCLYLAHSNPPRCSSWEERVRQTRSCGRVPALTFLTPILTGQQLSLCGQ